MATAKKSAAKKPAAKKPAAKKPAAKKPAAKKPAAKKPAAKKPAAKKPAAKKPAAKKKPKFNPEKVGADTTKNMKSAAKNIDRQMKKLASLDSRVLIAKDNLTELQKSIHIKRVEFQKKNTAAAKRAYDNLLKKIDNHNTLITSMKQTRAEIAAVLKDNKSMHNAYESVIKKIDKGRERAVVEAKKAEVLFMKNLHKIEAQMLKKAEEIKKNFNL